MHLKGHLTFSGMAVIEDILDTIRLNPCSSVILQLDQVEYIDSSGVGMLLMMQELCEERGAALELHSVPGQVKSVMQQTCLDQLFTLKTV